MSVEQYQRNVNSLDKEIASLEKRRLNRITKKDKFYAKKYNIADFRIYDSK